MSQKTPPMFECAYCHRHAMAIDSRLGRYYCTSCGCEAPEHYYDETAEYRQFALEHGVEDKSRSGYAGEAGQEELGTGIAYDGSKQCKDLTQLHRRYTSDSKEILIRNVNRKIRQKCGNLNLDKKIQQKAIDLYKESVTENKKKSRRTEAVIAACIRSACNSEGKSMLIETLLQEFGDITTKDITNAQKVIDTLPSAKPSIVSYGDTAKNYCTSLGCPPYVADAAEEVGNKLQEQNIPEIVSKKPQTVAGAVVALIMDKIHEDKIKRSMSDIASTVGVSEGTINSVLKILDSICDSVFGRLPLFSKLAS